MTLRIVASFCLFILSAHVAQADIKMATAIIPPYQDQDENGNLIGRSLPLVNCIMNTLNEPHSVSVYPWIRAQKIVEQEKYDAFFIASENQNRSAYARISEPLFDGARSWYLRESFHLRPGSQEFSETAYIGVVNGTNMHAWLKENFKNVTPKANEQELIKLLIAKRLDAILLTDLMYETVLEKMSIPMNAFQKIPSSKHPLGVYFGHHFLEQHPDFLTRFNQAIGPCKAKLN